MLLSILILILLLQGHPGIMGSPGRRGALVSRVDFCPSTPLLSFILWECASKARPWAAGGAPRGILLRGKDWEQGRGISHPWHCLPEQIQQQDWGWQ